MELDRLRLVVAGREIEPGEVDASFGQVDRLMRSLQDDVHDVLNALRPALLDSQGLVAAVETLCRDFETRHRVRCTLEAGIDEESLRPDQSIALYRIVQEALTNVARHARARAVGVRFDEDGSGMTLRVTDDGRGFDAAPAGGRGFGLMGIRERARQMGGMAAVTSAPGRGTEVRVELPRAAIRGEGVA
jgi:signal transduction histidine kinase